MAEKRKKHISSYDIADDLGLMALTPTRLISHAAYCCKVGKPLLVMGRPGQGKTELEEQLAVMFKKLSIVERLNGRDPTDFGIPKVYQDEQGNWRHLWTVPDFYNSANGDVPKDYPGGWVYFFDELAQALPAMQNRIGEILNERQLNRNPLHPKVWVMLASNFAQDKAATYPIPRQILNRCSVVVLVPEIDDTLRYMSVRNVRPELAAFAKLFPDCLDSYDADSMVNCTPRSLCSISPLMDQNPAFDEELPLYSSVIGKGYGSQLVGFLRVYRDLPKLENILANPRKEPIPDDDQVDVMCALAAMLGRATVKANVAQVMPYLTRLPSEFCVFALRDAVNRDPEIKTTRAMTDWANTHGSVLL